MRVMVSIFGLIDKSPYPLCAFEPGLSGEGFLTRAASLPVRCECIPLRAGKPKPAGQQLHLGPFARCTSVSCAIQAPDELLPEAQRPLCYGDRPGRGVPI